MNAHRLLAHYEMIADAPDAIPRLRRFILDLAVRGKLVEQNPNDEPAAELLTRIAEEKARLVKAGEIRGPKVPVLLNHDELPFPLPRAWVWTQIAELGVISPRNNSRDDHVASFVPMPMIPAGYGATNVHKPRPWGEIKKGYTHFAEGDVGLAKITPCFENGKSIVFRNLTGGIGSGTTELHVVRPLFVKGDYIVLFLKSPHFIETGIPRMTGTAGQKRVPAEYFANSPFPLPPLAEQHRIVAKVDELMALCDRLETARTARETTRNRLAAASLARLNAPDPDLAVFQNHAAFALDNLNPLTTRPDQIKALRQTILNLAVRGKLMKQDPNDEPASELLKRIARKKARLVKAGKISKKPSTLSYKPVNLDFLIPEEWTTVRLTDISNVVMGQSPPGETYNTYGEGVPLINGPVEFSEGAFGKTVVNQYTTAATNYCNKGDFLICVRGSTTGRTNIAAFEACIGRGVAAIQPVFDDVFVRLFLWGMRERIISMGRGIAFPSITRKQLENLPVPLPPLAEQRRIVAKVDELMALCDRLEASLATGDDTRCRLLDALLQEALTPSAEKIQQDIPTIAQKSVGQTTLVTQSADRANAG